MNTNENMFARSALPQPMRSPPPKKLSEMSAAANNARPTMLPPPGTLGKRKTLAERAGEPARPAPVPPGGRQIGSTVKPMSISGMARQNSYSTTTSSRATSSATSRNMSNGSFASSISGRAPSAQSVRSNTSTSRHTKSKSMYGRPTTSFEYNTVREGQDGTVNSIVNPFSSARQFSANTSRKKRAVVPDLRDTDFSDNDSERSISGSGYLRVHKRTRLLRDISLAADLEKLCLDGDGPLTLHPTLSKENVSPSPPTPSQIPRKRPSAPCLQASPTPAKSPKRSPRKSLFLTKDSNIKTVDWDLGSRVENMESMYLDLKQSMSTTAEESTSLKEKLNLYQARIVELEDLRRETQRDYRDLKEEFERTNKRTADMTLEMERTKHSHDMELSSSNHKLDELRRTHNNEIDELERKLRRDVNQAIQDAEQEKRQMERVHRDELVDLKRKLEKTLDEEREMRQKEVESLSSEGDQMRRKIQLELESKEKDLQILRESKERDSEISKGELDRVKDEISREKEKISKVRSQLEEANSTIVSNDSSMRSMRAHIEFLESDSKSQSQSFADLERKTQEAIREAEEARAKLRTEETLRRKLHNQVQELKGNIRVFCRVRPTLESEEKDRARIAFPDADVDAKELEVTGQEEKSSLGTITTKKNAFSFDRVFTPTAQNAEVFEEISQLVQSALDGYNVCIFCYGQTGSGKTYTMSSEDGMIPRAVNQIYETAQTLEEKGWKYSMEGSFVEVYNESINDLLGKAEDFDKKKHEIRHDTQKCKTTITDISTVDLDSPGKVESALRKAMNNRSIAATKANERSSRSHTVFILKLLGENSITGEKSEGTLNLVDLAGSERLSHSGATGERLKETQNINKSLSCLGDVIGALGQGKDGGHIPYRNSKLTYLLQYSLGGNSKTLMFVMVSPLAAHLSETVTSLKFATKVHNTHIGTAKRQARV